MLLWASSESVFTGCKSLLVRGYKYSATVPMGQRLDQKSFECCSACYFVTFHRHFCENVT
ncbi:hypothetical protein HMPREF1554_00979 [Porphyromonas gingivalis F0569]|uniref:Uncharacterized protein n=1 Tax=Porphyromonas gingivalis F0570 TaxID=1227271 RepID=A0A0E2LRF2_PORGN|nr:hypothetical protein HMPREF1555_01031 [Porphyromonas gingivalis F0570]ERJ67483.1 hypothetical protein HMPREF1554_00979 [Porphyromonas gingivalis F0569]ERJ69510.1 hypothetical protein HMPREF1553_00547 [Porphyromonas gingivalis F0568]